MLKDTKEVARYSALITYDDAWNKFKQSERYHPDLSYIILIEDDSDEEVSIDAFVIYEVF